MAKQQMIQNGFTKVPYKFIDVLDGGHQNLSYLINGVDFVQIESSFFDTFSNPKHCFFLLIGPVHIVIFLCDYQMLLFLILINHIKFTNIQFLALYLKKSPTLGDSTLPNLSVIIVDGFNAMHYGPLLACNYLCDVHNNFEAYKHNNMSHEQYFISN